MAIPSKTALGFIFIQFFSSCGPNDQGHSQPKTLVSVSPHQSFAYAEPYDLQHTHSLQMDRLNKKSPPAHMVCVYRGLPLGLKDVSKTYKMVLETPHPVLQKDVEKHYNDLFKWKVPLVQTIKSHPLKACLLLGAAEAFVFQCPPSPTFWGIFFLLSYTHNDVYKMLYDKIRYRGIATPTGQSATLGAQHPLKAFVTTDERVEAFFTAARLANDHGPFLGLTCAPQPLVQHLIFSSPPPF